jgi:hypothetical protein
VIVGPHQRELFNSDGIRHYPIQQNLLAPALFAATYSHRLTTRQTRQILAVTAAMIGVSLSVVERPVRLRDLGLGMTWVVAAYLSVGRVQSELELADARRAEDLARAARIDLEDAWLQGRQSVLELVQQSWSEAAKHLEAGRADGPEPPITSSMAVELERRLEAARAQLDALSWSE